MYEKFLCIFTKLYNYVTFLKNKVDKVIKLWYYIIKGKEIKLIRLKNTVLSVTRGEGEKTMSYIKKLRKDKGLTQEELGKAIGKSKNYIADLESGKRSVSGIAGETLVRLAQELSAEPESIVDPPAELKDEDFEWDKIYDEGDDSDYMLIVDKAVYSKKLNSIAFCIEGIWYRPITKGFRKIEKSRPLGEQIKLIKSFVEEAKEATNDIMYMTNIVPREGFKINIGREITTSEFDELKDKLKLTDNDISEPFVDRKGDIYGKYRKIYESVQISIDYMSEISVEKALRAKGIETANIAPGRINIRVK